MSKKGLFFAAAAVLAIGFALFYPGALDSRRSCFKKQRPMHHDIVQCRSSLGSLKSLMVAYMAEWDAWPDDPSKVGFKPENGDEYQYKIFFTSPKGFIAGCIGNLDKDDKLDIWTYDSFRDELDFFSDDCTDEPARESLAENVEKLIAAHRCRVNQEECRSSLLKIAMENLRYLHSHGSFSDDLGKLNFAPVGTVPYRYRVHFGDDAGFVASCIAAFDGAKREDAWVLGYVHPYGPFAVSTSEIEPGMRTISDGCGGTEKRPPEEYIDSLLSLRGSGNADRLLAALGDGDPAVRAAAVGAVAKLPRSDDLLQRLATLVKSGRGDGGMAAIAALGALGDARALPVLFETLLNGGTSASYSASGAIARIRDPSSIDTLIDILRGASSRQEMWIGGAAVTSLRKMTGEDFRGDADKWEQWWVGRKKVLGKPGRTPAG